MFFCSETNFKEFASPLDAVQTRLVQLEILIRVSRFVILLAVQRRGLNSLNSPLIFVVEGYLGRRMNLCHKHEGTRLLYQRQPGLAE